MAIAVLVLFAFEGRAQDTIRSFTLGSAVVQLVEHRTDHPGPLFFNMHDNEQTSVVAAAAVLGSTGGCLFELSHSGKRYIEFDLDAVRYVIDPNRIYTDAGRWREMRRAFDQDSIARADSLHLRHAALVRTTAALWIALPDTTVDSLIQILTTALDHWMIPQILEPFYYTGRDTVVFGLIRSFADTILNIMQIDSQQLVVALHNNYDGGYSMSSYRVDSVYAQEAQAIYIGLHPDPDDFFFVTDRRIFEAFQPSYYHLVLQDNARMTDDGSLSVYCGQRGIPYVNVEAQHGHLFDQHSMLHYLMERLRSAWLR